MKTTKTQIPLGRMTMTMILTIKGQCIIASSASASEVSYTPPGCVRRRVKRRKITKEDTPPQDSNDIDVDDALFEF